MAVHDAVGDAPVQAQLEPALQRPDAAARVQREAVVVGRRAPQLQARAVEDQRQVGRRARGPRGGRGAAAGGRSSNCCQATSWSPS